VDTKYSTDRPVEELTERAVKTDIDTRDRARKWHTSNEGNLQLRDPFSATMPSNL